MSAMLMIFVSVACLNAAEDFKEVLFFFWLNCGRVIASMRSPVYAKTSFCLCNIALFSLAYGPLFRSQPRLILITIGISTSIHLLKYQQPLEQFLQLSKCHLHEHISSIRLLQL